MRHEAAFGMTLHWRREEFSMAEDATRNRARNALTQRVTVIEGANLSSMAASRRLLSGRLPFTGSTGLSRPCPAMLATGVGGKPMAAMWLRPDGCRDRWWGGWSAAAAVEMRPALRQQYGRLPTLVVLKGRMSASPVDDSHFRPVAVIHYLGGSMAGNQVGQSSGTTNHGWTARRAQKTVVEMPSDHFKINFGKQRPNNSMATGTESVGDRGNPVQLEWFAKFWQTS